MPVFFRRCPAGCFQSRTIGSGSASWTCPDQTGASLGLGVARGLWFSSDNALTGCWKISNKPFSGEGLRGLHKAFWGTWGFPALSGSGGVWRILEALENPGALESLQRPPQGPWRPRRPWAPRPLTLRMPAEKLREASGRGLRPLQKDSCRAPDGLLASALPGLPRSPQLPVGLGALSPAGGLGSRAASPAGFGAFALLDGPGLTQGLGVWGFMD